MSGFASGEQTFNETQYINELKLAAGIGLVDIHEKDNEDEEGDKNNEYYSCDIGDINVPSVAETVTASSQVAVCNIRDLIEKYRKPDQSSDNKVYTRLLLRDEFVVKESYVCKRSGWSYRYRWLVLTSLPRLFYTTADGLYKGMIPWSMTEPIEVEVKDKTHFDISVHNSSRIYHFNDKVNGAEEWMSIISEISECWKNYLSENAPEKVNAGKLGGALRR